LREWSVILCGVNYLLYTSNPLPHGPRAKITLEFNRAKAQNILERKKSGKDLFLSFYLEIV
jgi:hypothetical protein